MPSIASLSLFRRLLRWLVLAAVLGSVGAVAVAQSEPTLNDIYTTAQAGRLDEAQKMITHVLVTHPDSARARYVQSELFARQNRLGEARSALAAAEKLSPGLPFVKPEALRALRAQLAAAGPGASGGGDSRAPVSSVRAQAGPAGGPPSAAAGVASWALPALLAVVVIVAGYFMFRRRPPASAPTGFGGAAGRPQGYAPGYAPGSAPGYPPGYAQGSMPAQGGGLSGPQTFGSAASGAGVPPASYPPGYAPGTGYPQPYAPAYPPAAQGPGLGRQIAGGVATGLAVGAGVMAAQAFARNLSERNDAGHGDMNTGHAAQGGGHDALSNVNTDMGGNDFGIADGGSWDDGGGSFSDGGGGGGDWDT